MNTCFAVYYIIKKANWGVAINNCKKGECIKHFLQLCTSCLQVVHFVAENHKNHYVSNVINCFNAHIYTRIIGPILIGITSLQKHVLRILTYVTKSCNKCKQHNV